ncbi:MAG: UPF0182 family protein [Thermodesulfobacteriota bacterium]|nr:UPF0182 family protein [Thermodesulfobacteriota bacterium]
MPKTQKEKKGWKGRLIVLLIALIVLAAIGIAGTVLGVDYLVDIWWFSALGYGFYYWQRLLYSYTVFGAVFLIFFLFFFVNFRFAVRSFQATSKRDHKTGDKTEGRLKTLPGAPSFWAGLLAVALSIPLTLPIFRNWQTFLFYIFGQQTGTADPYFGRDAGFYLFQFPFYTLIQSRLLLAMVILLAALVLLYVIKNHRRQRPLNAFERGDRWHIIIAILLLTGVGIWDFLLQRYGLLYDNTHKPLFYGPGYVQMKVILPLIWACIITLVLAALGWIVIFYRHKGYLFGPVLILLFLGALWLRHTRYLPEMVETYVVKPNQLEKESPFIANHVQATLNAYKLSGVETREFRHEGLPTMTEVSVMEDILHNIPVWDAETLIDVFEQLQELRTYYIFPTVNVGRYQVEGRQQQVFLAPREIEFDNLPGEAINWINKHLTYTHGYGAVMTPASQKGGEQIIWYLSNIPPESRYGLTTDQPEIYYGLGKYTYSIAPNNSGEMDYPAGSTNVQNNYDGLGGVPFSSLARKALLAYAFKNKKIFFSTQITDESRILFRRNIVDRVRHLVPFLKLDKTPYLTVTADGIYWIVDAYTTSGRYPASAPQSLNGDTFNYIRNSVKIVVDAYNGTIDLYVFDETDPVIRAYDAIYPGLFKSKTELPPALEKHIRYPKDFFDVQMNIYAAYHQTEPHVFYQQEDLWTFADTAIENVTLPASPYYVTLDLIRKGRMEFLLLQPMFPKKRDNLRAVAVAGCDPESYGKIIVYDFPKGQLVYGPAQIDALINQSPDIAEQFTLWDQAGSSVVRGKMLILLLENSVLFIQPVYLKATSRVKIPQLQRIIMSEGETVVMKKSVQEAYAALRHLVDAPSKDAVEIETQMDSPPEKPEPEPEPEPEQKPKTETPVPQQQGNSGKS